MTIIFLRPADLLAPLCSSMSVMIAGYQVTSIEMAFWLLLFLLHSKTDLATKLTSKRGLLHRPDGIFTWVSGSKFRIKSYWIFSLEKVYWCIMQHLLTIGNNPFHAEFIRLSANHRSEEVKFALLCRKPEFVWSCGLNQRSDRLDRYAEFGFNLYGDLLSSIYECWKAGNYRTNIPVPYLLSLSAGDDFRRTVLLLADSECNQVFNIRNGHAVRKRGAKYHDLAALITRRDIRLTDYKYIAIVCGVNLCRRYYTEADWERSWRALERQLQSVTYPGSPHRIILNTPIWNPKAPRVADHAAWITQRTSYLENVTICDWSQTVDNPFVLNDNTNHPKIDKVKYYKDKFHINHAGFRELWVRWTEIFAELITVAYDMVAWY